MAPPTALRVVGRDQTQQQLQTLDAARAQSAIPPSLAPSPPAPVGLAGFINDQYTMMRRHRDTAGRGWADRLLRALRAFDGVYDPDVLADIKRFGGSDVYARIVAMKCRGTSSLLRDVYLGPDRPWGLEAASDPPIPPDIHQAIQTVVQGEVQQAIEQHTNAVHMQQAHLAGQAAIMSYAGQTGQDPSSIQTPPPPPPPPDLPDASSIRDRYNSLVEDARDQAKRKAYEQAKVAEDKIEEILAEGGFYKALAECLFDLPVFPYAIIKGPVVRIKTVVEWRPQPQLMSPQAFMNPQALSQLQPNSPNSPVAIDKPMLTWERVSPFDIFWTPGVSDIADANVIQRSRLTRAEINDLLDLPGYIVDEVRAVLDEYGRGGITDNWDVTDSERSILESREDPRFNQSGMIACIEFQGNAQGQYLLDMGMDPQKVPDPLRDYFCNAWLIGRHIIKVQLSPSPRKRHNYYVSSFEKVPGTVVGNGLPDLLSDVSTVANATLRALVNNLSISSGPQVTVNEDRLADGENGDELYPWKRWRVKSDSFGNNTEPPIGFFNPQSNAQELLQVYTAFSSLADEMSAIPKFMTGSPPQGGLGRTASGLAMLMSNSAKILQTVAANVDRDIMEGVLTGLIDMVMLTDQTGLLSGEEKIRVLGVGVAIQRETQRSRQLEFLQLTGNPIDMSIIGPKGRAEILRQVAQTIGLPGEDIVPSAEKMDEQQKQAQQQAQMQGMLGHAAPGSPGVPPGGGAGPGAPPGGGQPQGAGQQPGGPPQAPNAGAPGAVPQAGPPGGPPPQAMSKTGAPHLNLVNRNQGGGPPVQGGPQ